MARAGVWTGVLGLFFLVGPAPRPVTAQVEIPEAFAPLEYLVGGWNGTGVPVANKIKGWPEKHLWSWKFVQGKPVALTVTMQGNKLLSKGTVTYDTPARQYRLDGLDADGKPVVYLGTLDDETHRMLVLKPEGDGDAQLTLRLLENKIRYTLWIDRKAKGAARPAREIEVGVTKEGEAFAAAGGAAANQAKCIVTGGAATIYVTYQGKSYPLCCTGCRDEFHENPAKYVAKASQIAAGKTETPKSAPPNPPSTPKAEGTADAASKTKAGEPPVTGKAEAPDPKVKAASLLRLGQALERSGKKLAALDYYRRLIKEAPDAPEAKTAAERIKALEGK